MDKKPKKLFDTEDKTPKKLFERERFSSVQIQYSKNKNPKQPKSLFDNASVSNTEMALKYIETNYSEAIIDKEKLKRQIKQLFPLNIETILSWGGNTVELLGENTDKISKLSLAITSTNLSECIEETVEFINKKQGFSFFSKQIDLNQNKINLAKYKQELSQALLDLDPKEKELDYAEKRIQTNYLSLLGVRETNNVQDDLIKNAIINRTQLLQGCIQQIRLNQMKIKQVKQFIIDRIQRIDQLLQVTIPAFEATK